MTGFIRRSSREKQSLRLKMFTGSQSSLMPITWQAESPHALICTSTSMIMPRLQLSQASGMSSAEQPTITADSKLWSRTILILMITIRSYLSSSDSMPNIPPAKIILSSCQNWRTSIMRLFILIFRRLLMKSKDVRKDTALLLQFSLTRWASLTSAAADSTAYGLLMRTGISSRSAASGPYLMHAPT